MAKRERESPTVEDDGPKKIPKNELDLNRAHNEVWLVKIPASVHAAWQSLEAGTDVGKLIVRRDPQTGRPSMTVQLDTKPQQSAGAAAAAAAGPATASGPAGAAEGAPGLRALGGGGVGKAASSSGTGRSGMVLPTTYTLQGERPVTDRLAWSKAGPEGWPAVVATVVRQYNMQPRMDQRYRTMTQQRLYSETIQRKFVKPVEAVGPTNPNSLARYKAVNFQSAVELKKKADAAKADEESAADGGKRERMDEAELRRKLFEKFAEKERWTLKELNVVYRQPESYMKGILKSIAVMHRKGVFKHQYELQPQFRGGGGGGDDGGAGVKIED